MCCYWTKAFSSFTGCIWSCLRGRIWRPYNHGMFGLPIGGIEYSGLSWQMTRLYFHKLRMDQSLQCAGGASSMTLLSRYSLAITRGVSPGSIIMLI